MQVVSELDLGEGQAIALGWAARRLNHCDRAARDVRTRSRIAEIESREGSRAGQRLSQLERQLAAAQPAGEQQAEIEMLGRADPVVPPRIKESANVVVGSPPGGGTIGVVPSVRGPKLVTTPAPLSTSALAYQPVQGSASLLRVSKVKRASKIWNAPSSRMGLGRHGPVLSNSEKGAPAFREFRWS